MNITIHIDRKPLEVDIEPILRNGVMYKPHTAWCSIWTDKGIISPDESKDEIIKMVLEAE